MNVQLLGYHTFLLNLSIILYLLCTVLLFILNIGAYLLLQ